MEVLVTMMENVYAQQNTQDVIVKAPFVTELIAKITGLVLTEFVTVFPVMLAFSTAAFRLFT